MSTTLACERQPPAPAADAAVRVVAAHLATPHDAGTRGLVEFVSHSFQDLYPIFLVRRSMPLGEKSGLWQRSYYGRWVRWRGTVRSVTPNGIAVRMQPLSATFDVSLWIDAFGRDTHHVKRGDKVTFIGRLESYDDVLQKLYLIHGSIVEVHPRGAAPDAGEP